MSHTGSQPPFPAVLSGFRFLPGEDFLFHPDGFRHTLGLPVSPCRSSSFRKIPFWAQIVPKEAPSKSLSAVFHKGLPGFHRFFPESVYEEADPLPPIHSGHPEACTCPLPLPAVYSHTASVPSEVLSPYRASCCRENRRISMPEHPSESLYHLRLLPEQVSAFPGSRSEDY